jgi:RimJ/RimL family protein N-acetyltransferase
MSPITNEHYHSSHICAVYPRFFVNLATIRTFASSNDKKKMETERILLRSWQDSDAEALFKYASDPEVGPRAGWPPHKSVEDSLEIIRTVFTAEEMWAVIWKASGRVMEKCGFVDTGEEAICPNLEVGSDCPVRVMKLIKK